jgi:hypothetical protein
MAWLEKRGDTYHVNFFHGGRHFSRSLKTGSDRKAAGMQARLEENLLDVERGRLVVPPDADFVQFLLTDGRVERKVVVGNELLLETLFDRYKKEVPGGAKESNTRYIEDIHIGHLQRSDELIVRLARVLDADPDELLILAQKVPDTIRKRVLQRPDVFRRLSGLDDKKLDAVMAFWSLKHAEKLAQ